MADNFDLKKFLVENKLGPFAKVKSINENQVAEDEAKTLMAKGEEDEAYDLLTVQYDYSPQAANAALDRIANELSPYSVEDDDDMYDDLKRDDAEINRLEESLSAETIDSIERIIVQKNLKTDITAAFEYLDAVAQVLDDEGVSQADIADYIHMRISDYYGKPSLREEGVIAGTGGDDDYDGRDDARRTGETFVPWSKIEQAYIDTRKQSLGALYQRLKTMGITDEQELEGIVDRLLAKPPRVPQQFNFRR